MWLLLAIVFAVSAFLYLSEQKQKRLQRRLELNGRGMVDVWMKKNYNATFLAIALFLGFFWLWCIDTNDLELTCSNGQCFQTKLQVIHKVGFFGLAPKYFRSFAEPFAFGPGFDYKITKDTCGRRSSKTQWNVVLTGPESRNRHIQSFCSDEKGAHHLQMQLNTCIKEEHCYFKIESGFWEEFFGGAAVVLFLLCLLKGNDLEYLLLDDSRGTVEIVKQSIVGNKILQVHILAASIESEAYVKEYVHKGKYSTTRTYTFSLSIEGGTHHVLESSDRFYIKGIVDKFNQFVQVWKAKSFADSSLVKLKYDCVVCFEEKVDTMFLPCAHACVCSHCSVRLEKCPLCRKRIRVKKHIFLETGES